MGHLGVVLYEYLGEEYPEVLGSILGALKAIVNVIGMFVYSIRSCSRAKRKGIIKLCLFIFNRHAQDDTTNQRSAATAYTYFEEQT